MLGCHLACVVAGSNHNQNASAERPLHTGIDTASTVPEARFAWALAGGIQGRNGG